MYEMFSDSGRCLKRGEQEYMMNKKADHVWESMRHDVRVFSMTTVAVTDLHHEMAVHFTHEVGHGIVEYALKELEMHKVCACWVPPELVLEMWEPQVVTAQTFLVTKTMGPNCLGPKLTEWNILKKSL